MGAKVAKAKRKEGSSWQPTQTSRSLTSTSKFGIKQGGYQKEVVYQVMPRTGSVERLWGGVVPSKKEKEKKKERDVTYWVNHATRDAAVQPRSEDVESELHVRFAADAKDDDDDHTTSGTSTDSTMSSEPVALDGGCRAWAMVGLSFMMHAVCDGISFSIGIIFHSMQEHFGVSKSQAGIINSFLLSLPLLLSPIAGTFTDIYDCKKTAIGGSVILVIGFVLASLTSNYFLFLFFFAGLGGIGMCFNYNSAVVIVTYYFSSRRSLATACAVSGTGIGTLFISQALNQSIKLGFQAAIWTCAGLAIFLLFLVVKDMVEFAPARRAFSCPNLADTDGLRANSLTSATSTQVIPAVDKNFPRSASVSTFRKKPSSVALNSDYTMLHMSKFEHLDLELGKSPSNTITKSRKRVNSKTSQSIDALNLEANLDRTPSSSASSVTSSEESNHGDSSSSELSESEENEIELDEKTKFLTQLNGSVAPPNRLLSARETGRVVPRSSLKPNTATNTMAFTRVPAANAYRYRYDRTQLIRSKTGYGSAPNLYVRKAKKRSNGKIFREMFLVSFFDTINAMKKSLQDVYNFTYLISCFIFYFLYDIMYVNLPEYLEEQWAWTADDASYVIMAISVSTFVGMIIWGFVGDREIMVKHLFLILGLATSMAAVPIYMVTLSGEKWVIYTAASIFGVFISNSYVLSSVTIVEINGLSDFQAGYSLLGFVQGLGNLIGPTVIGFARDRLGTYILVFRLSSFGLGMSGLLCLWLYTKIVRAGFKWRDFDNDDEESEEGDDPKTVENGHAAPMSNTQRFIKTMHEKELHLPEAYPLFNREV
ncbi:gem-1 [Pristionchus pacificus]|uniref:Gem-1 n=1 Tax=Pristionchus pacificus TaxID=54126 RepID=A0A2A6D2R5_PRIPA|nr:gem-1 [Pristionchus pacificus]|eukprot:PDM84583.1 gem-1 [Pristionchus pacificus]